MTQARSPRRPPLDPHRRAYFQTLRVYCLKLDLPQNAETRHAATREALGYDTSSKDFTETEWDLVLEFLRHRINGNAGEWTPAHRVAVEVEGERRRKLWRIRREIPDAYLAQVAWDKFGRRDYQSMTLPQLEQLRITAIARKRAADRRGETLDPEA